MVVTSIQYCDTATTTSANPKPMGQTRCMRFSSSGAASRSRSSPVTPRWMSPASSDARGDYRIVDMQPGTYRVQATQTGFATLVLNNVQLLVGQTVTLPLALRLPTVSQTVEVQSDAELINTETQDVGGNINRIQMDEIPLLGSQPGPRTLFGGAASASPA